MKHRPAVVWIRWLLILVALVAGAAAVLGYALSWLRPELTVTHPVEAPVVQAFYATGTLLPEREYPIKANNPGIITAVFVDKGDHVKKGQPLATVTEDSVQYRYAQAKADRDFKAKLAADDSPVLAEFDARIAAFKDLLSIAQREQKRLTDMMEKNAASQTDLDRAMDRVKTLWSESEAAKAQRATKKLELQKDLQLADAALETAQWNVDRQTIRSPIDGVVLDRPNTVGTRLAVNDHIMQVADVRPDQLVMRAAVDEEDKTLVHLGQIVRMTLYAYSDRLPGGNVQAARVFDGKVKRIYDKADPERRTFEVDVDMQEKDPGFSAGMTGELAFVIAQKDRAMVIPSQAVQAGRIWVVRDGRLARTDARLGLSSIERVEVLSGLRGDEMVVISPIDKLADGQFVRTTYLDPLKAAELNKPKEGEGNVFRGFK